MSTPQGLPWVMGVALGLVQRLAPNLFIPTRESFSSLLRYNKNTTTMFDRTVVLKPSRKGTELGQKIIFPYVSLSNSPKQ